MFYEEEQINDLMSCNKCNERLDEPRILPCGDTVCLSCASSIQVISEHFECILCNKKHAMPREGLPISKKLISLISMQPVEFYRGQAAEKLKETLNDLQKKITSLKFGVKNGIDKIKELCIDLRSNVQLATEEAIQKLNEHSDELINEINQFEIDCTKAYQTNESDKEEAVETILTGELFLTKWTQYLKQPKISDEEIKIANEEASSLNILAEKDLFKLDCLIFRGNLLKFTKNSNKLEKNMLGVLEIESLRDFESVILSSRQQQIQLMKVCEFSLNQKWKLIYRATRDGFKAADFHSKCDHISNTLVIIKSTSGNVFGGYTQQNWLQTNIVNSSKTDPNAFIFSFINKDNRPLLMKCQDPATAIYCHNGFGPLFGIGNYIRIQDNSNLNDENYSDLGKTYRHPEYVHGSQEAKSFLAGTFKFKTTEIEVFVQC